MTQVLTVAQTLLYILLEHPKGKEVFSFLSKLNSRGRRLLVCRHRPRRVEGERMIFSRFATIIKLTRKYSLRRGRITRITIHHSASVNTADEIATFFANSKKVASANYCIGVNGDIAVSVPEEFRAWTSSNRDNDDTAITIEVSNSSAKGDYPISDASYDALIKLCVDICERNDIKSVYYDGTPRATLTEHRMFAPTACPGDYIHNLLKSGKIAKDINSRLDGGIVYGGGFTAYGLDFEPVFHPEYYSSRYPDLAAAGLKTNELLFAHFIQCGMNEARQGSVVFDPVRYRNINTDLQAALQDDWEAYYKHYLICGRAEIAAGERREFMR